MRAGESGTRLHPTFSSAGLAATLTPDAAEFLRPGRSMIDITAFNDSGPPVPVVKVRVRSGAICATPGCAWGCHRAARSIPDPYDHTSFWVRRYEAQAPVNCLTGASGLPHYPNGKSEQQSENDNKQLGCDLRFRFWHA